MSKEKFLPNQAQHLKTFGSPSDEDLSIIKKFMQKDFSKEDIYVYSLRLCDNLLDREGEFLSIPALQQLEQLLVGVTGIFNHEWVMENQHSRIYKTKLVTEPQVKNETLEPYTYIVGYAYTLKSEKNNSLIERIESGLVNEVSIGFKHNKTTTLSLEGVGDVVRIDDITDVFEWSFVAVPAQKYAGVVKSYKSKIKEGNTQMNPSEALAKLKSLQGVDTEAIITLSTTLKEIDSLKATVKSLEVENEETKAKVKELEQELVNTALEHAISDVLDGLNLVSDTAASIARGVAEKGVSINEDGSVTGVEETKELLLKDYPFLMQPDAPDVEEEVEEVAVKSASKGLKQVPKTLDFSKVPEIRKKSATTIKRGIHF